MTENQGVDDGRRVRNRADVADGQSASRGSEFDRMRGRSVPERLESAPDGTVPHPLVEDGHDLFADLFGLDGHLRRTYAALCAFPGSTASDLATDLDRDPSTVTRALADLRSKGLATRRRESLPDGGVVYYHHPHDPSAVADRMGRALDAWVFLARRRIAAFETRHDVGTGPHQQSLGDE